MASPFLGEFAGTLVLILLGDGVCASVTLARSKAQGAGWIAVTAGWCFAVMAGIFTAVACGSNDAYLNPAVTLGFAIASGDYSKIPSYFIAELLGAFCGAVLVWLHFLPHWKGTSDQASKLGVFCTSPAIPNAAANLLSEIIGTLVLVFVAGAILSKAVASPSALPAGLGAYLVACLIWGIGLGLGGTTGYAINPARDFGPRLAHAVLPIAGKGGSDWSYSPIPILGPLIGGAIAGALIRLIVAR